MGQAAQASGPGHQQQNKQDQASNNLKDHHELYALNPDFDMFPGQEFEAAERTIVSSLLSKLSRILNCGKRNRGTQ